MTRHNFTQSNPCTSKTEIWSSCHTPGAWGIFLGRLVRAHPRRRWSRPGLAQAAGCSRTTADRWIAAQLSAGTMAVAGRTAGARGEMDVMRPVLTSRPGPARGAEERCTEVRQAASECHPAARVSTERTEADDARDRLGDPWQAVEAALRHDARDRLGEPRQAAQAASAQEDDWLRAPDARGFWWAGRRTDGGEIVGVELFRVFGSRWRGYSAVSWSELESALVMPGARPTASPVCAMPPYAWQRVPGPTTTVA